MSKGKVALPVPNIKRVVEYLHGQSPIGKKDFTHLLPQAHIDSDRTFKPDPAHIVKKSELIGRV